MKVALYGKVEFDSYSGELTMLHPEFEILSGDDDDGDATLHVGRVVPIYEGVSKLTTRVLRNFTHRILESHRAGGGLPAAATCARAETAGPLDGHPRRRISRRPIPTCACSTPSASPAQFRLIFEEFFWLECGVALKRNKARTLPGIAFEIDDRVRERGQGHAAV